MIVLVFILAVVFGRSQVQSPDSVLASAPEKVHYAEKRIASPLLLPPAGLNSPIASCKEQRNGEVRLSMVIDSTGQPREVFFDRPLGNSLDLLALKVAEQDRFQPATLDGRPVAVGRIVAMKIHACELPAQDDSAKQTLKLKLMAWPDQNFEIAPRPSGEMTIVPGQSEDDTHNPHIEAGAKVTEPRVLFQPEAPYSEFGKKQNINGTVAFNLVVDAHGLPRDIKLIHSLEPSMDKSAAETVARYRFRPAMAGGRPIATSISVVIRFRRF